MALQKYVAEAFTVSKCLSCHELVINGRIYDEKKGVIEFAHALCASLDDHFFEAGLNSEDFSYISFDGNTLKSKKRLI